MLRKSKRLRKFRKKLEKKRSLKLNLPKHIGSRPFSDVYVASADNQKQYIIKVGKTSRNIKHEYKYYKLVNSLGINSLVPVYFSSKYSAMVTEKKTIKAYYQYLATLVSRKEYEQSLIKFGQFAKELEEKTKLSKFQNTSFSVQQLLLEQLDKCKHLSKKLDLKLRSWIIENKQFLEVELGESSLATDFNFYNVHVDQNQDFVLVDLGDAHFWPRESNIAYVFLQFKYNKLSKPKMTENDFHFFAEGYNGQDLLTSKMFTAFVIFHLLGMIEFYRMNLMQRDNIPSKLKSYYDKYIKAKLMDNYAVKLLSK